MFRGTSVSSALISIFVLNVVSAWAAVPSFRVDQYTASSSVHAVQADLNQDGAFDFIIGNEIWLSNGDGTYRAGGTINARGEVIGAGDFDADGHADLVFAVTGAQDFQIAYGKGDGTFRTVIDYPGVPLNGGNFIDKAIAADFNRDGKTDLAVFTTDATSAVKRIYTLINTGTSFSPQGPWAVESSFHDPVTGAEDPWTTGDFVLGDFDSDGNADVAYSVFADVGSPSPLHYKVVALFGNAAAALGSPVIVKDSDGAFPVTSGDVDQDAHSDLAGSFWGVSCETICQQGIVVFYGSSARTFTERRSSTGFLWRYPEVADFNGDQRQDIAMITDDAPNSTFGFDVGTQKLSDSFASPQYFTLGPFPQVRGLVPARFLLTGDYDRDGKPDLMTVSDNDKTLFVALNTTTAAKFPKCLPSGAQSVHVCSPVAGAKVKSPVSFHVGASNFTPIRKVEVWVDGKKEKETFFSYSDYSYMDTKISMASGSHSVSVFAVGYDSDFIKNSFTINVKP